MMGLGPLNKRHQRVLSLSLHHMRTERNQLSAVQKQALTRNRIFWHLDLGFSASRTVRHNCLVVNHPVKRLGYDIQEQ